MKETKVAILLSSYNGEKYIKEQLNSILEQTYSNFEIWVRDDGSKDNTIQILKEYEKTGKINLMIGKNVGFINSFFELLKQANADFYAFADQDDIWKKDKIQRAVIMLESQSNKEIPTMYYSNYDLYIEQTKEVKKPFKRDRTSFENSLLECVNLGMTTVINQKAKEILVKRLPNQETCNGHDWWIYLICSAFGKIIYDEIETAKHRMHGHNTSLCGESFFKKQIRRIKSIKNSHFKKVGRQIEQFSDYYREDLEENKKKILDLFDPRKKSLIKQIQKFFIPRRIMNLLSEEIILRISILMGMI